MAHETLLAGGILREERGCVIRVHTSIDALLHVGTRRHERRSLRGFEAHERWIGEQGSRTRGQVLGCRGVEMGTALCRSLPGVRRQAAAGRLVRAGMAPGSCSTSRPCARRRIEAPGVNARRERGPLSDYRHDDEIRLA